MGLDDCGVVWYLLVSPLLVMVVIELDDQVMVCCLLVEAKAWSLTAGLWYAICLWVMLVR
jgi:hypothetical protein